MCLNCHVITLAVEIRSLAALRAACERLGWQFKEDCPTWRWAGYWADDSPVPRNLFADQAEYDRVLAMSRDERTATMEELLGTCAHAIHVPGFEYELAVFPV